MFGAVDLTALKRSVQKMTTLEEALPRLARNEMCELHLEDDVSAWQAKHLRKALMTCVSLKVLHLHGKNVSADLCKGIVGEFKREAGCWFFERLCHGLSLSI